jgi:hypothetical protein
MISLAEEPQPITIIGEEWENAPNWMDKNYIFKYRNTYYLSWGRDYATSSNIYGPYTCAGAVGHGHHLNEFAHGSFFWWKGQFYHIWCYYIDRKYKFRESIMSYCHIDESGKLVTDTRFLDKHFSYGVGRYHASWPKIEAEWYSSASPGIEKISAGKDNFVLSNIRNGDSIAFANVTFENEPTEFIASVQNVKGNGKIVIREDSRSGKLLGEVNVEEKTHEGKSQSLSCKLKPDSGTKNIILVFDGEVDCEFHLDYIQFK